MCSFYISRVNVECLESFKRADIYSLGLILWEVCRRCISNGVALEYAMPYSEWLPSSNQEPSIEEMRKLVSFDQRRPSLPNRSHSDPVHFFIIIFNIFYQNETIKAIRSSLNLSLTLAQIMKLNTTFADISWNGEINARMLAWETSGQTTHT